MHAHRLRVAAAGLALYASLFALGHIEQPEDGAGRAIWGTLFLAGLVGPIVAVALASQEWPHWWLVPAVLIGFIAVPIAIETFEHVVRWDPVGTDHETDRSLRIDFVGTSFLSSLAWPLAVVALIGVPIGKRRAASLG